jgi:hypothetical protein
MLFVEARSSISVRSFMHRSSSARSVRGSVAAFERSACSRRLEIIGNPGWKLRKYTVCVV